MKLLKVIGWLFAPYIMIFIFWKKVGKMGRALGASWAVIALVIGSTANANQPEQSESQSVAVSAAVEADDKRLNTSQNEIDIPQYKIEKVEDVSFGNAVRYSYWVTTDPMVTEEQIKAISTEIVERAKIETPFNAIGIWFIDDPRQIGNGYTLANIEYSPNGEWAEATSVDTGNYSEHKFVYNIGSAISGLLPRDNENYPTIEELDMYFAFKALMDDQKNPIHEEMPLDTEDAMKWIQDNGKRSMAYEEEMIKKVAAQYNISIEDMITS